jgi:hypothetical protein
MCKAATNDIGFQEALVPLTSNRALGGEAAAAE